MHSGLYSRVFTVSPFRRSGFVCFGAEASFLCLKTSHCFLNCFTSVTMALSKVRSQRKIAYPNGEQAQRNRTAKISSPTRNGWSSQPTAAAAAATSASSTRTRTRTGTDRNNNKNKNKNFFWLHKKLDARSQTTTFPQLICLQPKLAKLG